MPTPVQPLPKENRHYCDYRDDLHHQQLAVILSELPDEHPARVAYISASIQGADTCVLSHLIESRDLVLRLMRAHNENSKRIWGKGR